MLVYQQKQFECHSHLNEETNSKIQRQQQHNIDTHKMRQNKFWTKFASACRVLIFFRTKGNKNVCVCVRVRFVGVIKECWGWQRANTSIMGGKILFTPFFHTHTQLPILLASSSRHPHPSFTLTLSSVREYTLSSFVILKIGGTNCLLVATQKRNRLR